jgi:hypothetical protein
LVTRPKSGGSATPNESGSNWDLPSGVFPHLIEWVILSINGTQLAGGEGGRPPSPPESPPHTPRDELEDNYEERDGSESEPEDNPYQIIVYQPPNMTGENENQNPPPYQPCLFVDAFIVPGIQHDMHETP